MVFAMGRVSTRSEEPEPDSKTFASVLASSRAACIVEAYCRPSLVPAVWAIDRALSNEDKIHAIRPAQGNSFAEMDLAWRVLQGCWDWTINAH